MNETVISLNKIVTRADRQLAIERGAVAAHEDPLAHDRFAVRRGVQEQFIRCDAEFLGNAGDLLGEVELARMQPPMTSSA